MEHLNVGSSAVGDHPERVFHHQCCASFFTLHMMHPFCTEWGLEFFVHRFGHVPAVDSGHQVLVSSSPEQDSF